MSNRTSAVIVTYEPEAEALLRLAKHLAPQVQAVFIIDNASGNFPAWNAALEPVVTGIIRLSSNNGISAALNRGFTAVQTHTTSEFCALFDQDSTPLDDMIQRLETHADQLASRAPFAQIGPYFFETNRGYYLPFIEFHHGFPRRKRDDGGPRVTTADYLITSGALISLAAITKVGPMDEDLFIDYVDIEWGLRAKAKGYQSYGAYDVTMTHTIGEKALEVATVRLAVHKPIRRYYYYRNALLLCRRPYISLSWKVNELCRLAIKFVIFALLSSRRREDIVMMSKGICDGLRGKGGKLD
ncbi:UNVERIFIED_ORG: rhamnosyltransferase [Burkholderia sp. 1263]